MRLTFDVKKGKLRLDGLMRLLIDFSLLLVSIVTAFVVRVFYEIWRLNKIGGSIDFASTFGHFLRDYVILGLIIPIVSIPIYYFSGFYTHGRSYTSKYKHILITFSVTTGYLLAATIYYFLSFPSIFPRSVLLVSWVLSLCLINGARLLKLMLVNSKVIEPGTTISKLSPKSKNVLVIGGAGYIGSVLVRQLLKRGYRVRVLDLLLYGEDSIKEIQSHPDFELLVGDFRNVADVVKAMQGVDSVIHLGAIVGDPACSLNDKVTIEVNLAAVRMIAEIAKANNVNKFIFASTCSVYGAGDHILDEYSSLNPLSLYAKTKLGAEKVLISLADSNFKPTICRLATVYGPSYRPRFDLVVNLLTAKAFFDGKITVYGGDQWRPFIHVKDVANAFITLLEAPQDIVGNEIFNIGSDAENYLIMDVAKIIKEVIPSAELIIENNISDKRNYRVNFSKIKDYVGFKTKYTVRDGVLGIKKALEDKLILDYHSPKYSNYNYLRDANIIKKLETPTTVEYLSKVLMLEVEM